MICWFEMSRNNTSRNRMFVIILSSQFSDKSGVQVFEKNFREFVSLSVAKSDMIIPQSRWVSHGDVYYAPKQDTLK